MTPKLVLLIRVDKEARVYQHQWLRPLRATDPVDNKEFPQIRVAVPAKLSPGESSFWDVRDLVVVL